MKNFLYAQKSDNYMFNEYEIVKELNTHNILYDRIDTYRDFTINLLHYIYDTYLGKEYIRNERDIIGHFNWCYMKVLNEFYEEELDFIDNIKIYEYFYAFYTDQFYLSKTKKPLNHFIIFWENIFSYNKNKNKKYLDILIEIYDIFNPSIEKKERKLELV